MAVLWPQLWANGGRWPGHGQLLSRRHVEEGRQPTYADPAIPLGYGYTVWLNDTDTVDNERVKFDGTFGQCGFASEKLNAVVVSMGTDVFGEGCDGVWARTKHLLSDSPAGSGPLDRGSEW